MTVRKRTRTDNLVNQVKKRAKKPIKKENNNCKNLIPSGSTLLNLACSDCYSGAFKLGRIVTIPGGSTAGKTLLMLTILAEICRLKRFDDYLLVYDDAEESLNFNISKLFGNKLEDRLQISNGSSSNTIQDFQNNILNLSKKNEPFIYVLDSLDSLSSDEELVKEYKKALAKAKSDDSIKEIKGSYKTEKAKIIGQVLRMVNGIIEDTKSSLFIIQQERARIGVSFGKAVTTSGGKAPFYYSSHQVWLNRIKTHKKRDRKIGTKVKAEVTKNKITGKEREITFDVFYDLGIDNIGSCVDFLINEGFWKKKKMTVNATDLELEASRSKIIRAIEEQNLEKDLDRIVSKAWHEIENSLKLDRKPKYE